MGEINIRLNTEHVKAMTKALEAVPVFTVNKTAGTVLAKTAKGVEIFRALKVGKADLWLVNHTDNLFTKRGKKCD